MLDDELPDDGPATEILRQSPREMFLEQFPTRQLKLIAGKLFDVAGQSVAWDNLPRNAFREGEAADDQTRVQALKRIAAVLKKGAVHRLRISTSGRSAVLEML
jgi:hypothetical protein